jgi:hypothetical protein
VLPVLSAYTAATSAYTVDAAISSNSPTTSGGAVVSWSVSPTLPTGLAFASGTGVVTGTPTAITAEAVYTVTVANTGGSDTFALTLEVVDGE